MAVVVDEYGSATGIITMEDIVEEVVGDIDVGYDFEEYLPRRKRALEALDENSWLVDSRLSVSEVNDLLEINLNTKASYTIGGLVMNQIGHIPDYGESMTEQGYEFSVHERTDKGIVKLKIESV
jgi:putative hemolysin